jgi:serine/threonine protein kinase
VLDLPALLSAALAERYTVERELGRGANATVYLAHERKHDRKVAVKVLLPELAQSVRAERFLREIDITAKLTHPHILPVFDSGEAGGFLYYVMPNIEGLSVRDRLDAVGRLEVSETVKIITDAAKAIDFANQHGVVHRDIKPDNILLSDGEALVADFGVARAISVAGGAKLTESGMTVGTPAYISPEQARGSQDLDGRSDLYSLACVAYEMLAGHPPFVAASPQELLARHAFDPVPTLRAARPDVPPGVERAIIRALSKSPERRFATATLFAHALTGESAAPAEAKPEAKGALARALRFIRPRQPPSG